MGEPFQTSLPMQSPLMASLSSSGKVPRESDLRSVLFASPLTRKKIALDGTATHWLAPVALEQVLTDFDNLQQSGSATLSGQVGDLCAAGTTRHLLACVQLRWTEAAVSHSSSFIAIVAAPVFGSASVSLDAVWEEDVLAQFVGDDAVSITSDLPALGMLLGRTRTAAPSRSEWSVSACVAAAGLVYFPTAGSLCSSVHDISRVIALPPGITYPLGVFWPLDIWL